MSVAFGLLAILFSITVLVGLLIAAFSKAKRRKALKVSAFAFLAVIGCVIGGVSTQDPQDVERYRAERDTREAEEAVAEAAEEANSQAQALAEAAEKAAIAAREAVAEAAEKGEDALSDDEKCFQDLQCVGNRLSRHTFACKPYIEQLARYDFEWTDGLIEPKFGHFRWADTSHRAIVVIGDKIKLQNGFGAWQNYVYECTYDPRTNTVLDVTARPGRL